MTDITELAQSLKAAAEKATQGNWRAFQYHDGRCGIGGGHNDEIMVCEHISKERPHDAMFIALANPANILALVEALEKAQRANAAQDDHINQQQDRIEQLEKGNQYAGKRIAELESRTVAVNLPDYRNTYKSPLADEVEHQVRLALELFSSAAGIKWEAE